MGGSEGTAPPTNHAPPSPHPSRPTKPNLHSPASFLLAMQHVAKKMHGAVFHPEPAESNPHPHFILLDHTSQHYVLLFHAFIFFNRTMHATCPAEPFPYTSVYKTVVRGPQVVLGFCPCGPLRLNISPKKTEKIKLK
jgi:hypothetical protein